MCECRVSKPAFILPHVRAQDKDTRMTSRKLGKSSMEP